jgi:hypothetical protein
MRIEMGRVGIWSPSPARENSPNYQPTNPHPRQARRELASGLRNTTGTR